MFYTGTTLHLPHLSSTTVPQACSTVGVSYALSTATSVIPFALGAAGVGALLPGLLDTVRVALLQSRTLLAAASTRTVSLPAAAAVAATLARLLLPLSNSLVVYEDAVLRFLLGSVVLAQAAHALTCAPPPGSAGAIVGWASVVLVLTRLSAVTTTCREEQTSSDSDGTETCMLTMLSGAYRQSQAVLHLAVVALVLLHVAQYAWYAHWKSLQRMGWFRMRLALPVIVLGIAMEWTLESLQGEQLSAATRVHGGYTGNQTASRHISHNASGNAHFRPRRGSP